MEIGSHAREPGPVSGWLASRNTSPTVFYRTGSIRPSQMYLQREGGRRMTLLGHVVVPVASEGDARATASALEPHLQEIEHVTAIHVVEKGGGTIDKAPMEKRRDDGRASLEIFEEMLDASLPVDTRVEFGTDVSETIVDTATAVDATAIAFRPRGGSRIMRLLSGDTTTKLVTEPTLPVISLPAPTEN